MPAIREAAGALIHAVSEELGARTLGPQQYARALRDLERGRGRPLLLPALSGGQGRGARVRLADGTWKLDFIGGIGVYGFGHGDRDLLETAAVAAACDVAFQGHLLPGVEYARLTRVLLRHAGPHLRHAWLSISGAMANENALKLIFQKHHPAARVVVFEGGFAGRTTTLAELTDRPEFRAGLPARGHALHVPFFDADPQGPEDAIRAAIDRSIAALDAHARRYPGDIAAMLFELVQGEGGVRTAPREFFVALMQRCRELGIAVWVDEIQTFARTGELFAFRTFGLEEYVDVVTLGKFLQGSAVLFTKAYNPKPGLLAGTYAGSSVGMALGARILERLESEGYLGPEGRIVVLGRRIRNRFELLAKRLPQAIRDYTGLGAMHAFVPFDGKKETAADVLRAAFEEGLFLFTAGQHPTRIRLLPPVNTTDEELEAGFAMLEKALRRVAEGRGIPC